MFATVSGPLRGLLGRVRMPRWVSVLLGVVS